MRSRRKTKAIINVICLDSMEYPLHIKILNIVLKNGSHLHDIQEKLKRRKKEMVRNLETMASQNLYTVDSRYLEIEGTLKNTSRYPCFDISDL